MTALTRGYSRNVGKSNAVSLNHVHAWYESKAEIKSVLDLKLFQLRFVAELQSIEMRF